MLKTKNYLLLISSLMLCSQAYAQTPMNFPNNVGVYTSNPQNTSQMRLPPQVGMYQRNMPSPQRNYINQYTVNPYKTKTVVDYSQYPTMNQQLYENVNGYKTPNKYVLQSPSVQARANTLSKEQKLAEEFGTEYYLSLAYGSGKFNGDGLTNEKIIPPLNNISEGLGDPKILNIGFGVMQNRDVRIEVGYTNLSGLKYDSTAYTEEQWCGPNEFGVNGDFLFDCNDESPVSGGSITSNALMLSVMVPLTDLFGELFDGTITPYIGGGFGMSFNTIGDYTVYDEYGNAEVPLSVNGSLYDENGEDQSGYYEYNGNITHFGATTTNVAWTIEAGLSFNLDKKTMLDVYYKMGNYGSVKSKDMVYYTYDSVDILDHIEDSNGTITCSEEALNEGFEYNSDTNWCEVEGGSSEGYITGATEKGKIETTEIGVKLRLIF